MTKRIIGIDVARALAIFGMVIVNFKMVFGQEGSSLIKPFLSIFDGKAAATFVVLAGVGLSFMTNKAKRNKDFTTLKSVKLRILRRALFLFVLGISYLFIWPADILHFYGIYMLVAFFLIDKKAKFSLILAGVLILVYPLLMYCYTYDQGWDFATFSYDGFWTVKGFFRNLFYNGFHPVIPWTAFMLIGVWFGKQDLTDDTFLKKMIIRSFLVFVLMLILSKGLIILLSGGSDTIAAELGLLLGTSPMPPLPIYMISASSIAIFTISICILIARRYSDNFLIKALVKTGQLALTFYVAHVVLGMGVMEEISSISLGKYSLNFSMIYALVFSIACVLFALLWTRYKKIGPLEWVMRKVTD